MSGNNIFSDLKDSVNWINLKEQVNKIRDYPHFPLEKKILISNIQKQVKDIDSYLDNKAKVIFESYPMSLMGNKEDINEFIDSCRINSSTLQVYIEKEPHNISTKSLEEILSSLNQMTELVYKINSENINEESYNKIRIKNEIEEKIKELDDLKNNQLTTFETLNDEIKGLLENATNIGLASAYKTQKESYEKTIKNNTYIFYIVMIAITIFSGLSIIKSFSFSPFAFNLVTFSNLTELGIHLIHKLPILLPAIWLAIFSSIRRSEAERLKQEYAHKEANTKSYHSFKEQIDNLNSKHREELLEKLLDSIIVTVSKNASETLDKKHEDKMPVIELSEKSLGKFAEIVKSVTNLKE